MCPEALSFTHGRRPQRRPTLILPGLLLLGTVLLPVTASAAIRCAVLSVSARGIEVSFRGTLSPLPDRPGPAPVFAYSTVPGAHDRIALWVTVGSTDAKGSLPPVPTHAGWVGGDYLQWVGVVLPSGIPIDKDLYVYGTASIVFERPSAYPLSMSDMRVRGNAVMFPVSQGIAKSSVTSLPELPFSTGVRFEVQKDGIYEISAGTLAALGVPIDRIPSRSYRMFLRDREIPVYITNPYRSRLQSDDKILFYGEYLRGTTGHFTQFSYANTYWLTWNGTAAGARVAEVSGDIRRDQSVYVDPAKAPREIRATAFNDTVHVELEEGIFWLGNVDEPTEMGEAPLAEVPIDNWCWGRIGVDDETRFKFTVPSPAASAGPARMRIGLTGITSIDSSAVDHDLSVLLNNNVPSSGQQMARAAWDGQEPYVFESEPFPARLLQSGTNELSFIVNRRAPSDLSALDWVQLIYPRSYQALDDRITFKNADSAVGAVVHYEVSGFSGDALELWDITHQRLFTKFQISDAATNSRGTRTLVFQDSVSSKTVYLAQARNKRLSPLRVVADTIPSGWDTLAGIDYVVIAPDSFQTELAPLLAMHRARGLRTAFVAVDDIYNRFSYGIRDPSSIRSFLAFLFSRPGKKPPRYLLLGGDTTHDLDKGDRGRNLVPTHMARIPGWGPGSDDGYFVTVHGDDDFPDLCVGRFPAQNRIQMRTMVGKTVRYTTQPNRGFWRDNLLLVGGGKKTESDFTMFNNEMTSEVIGPRMNILRMDADPNSPYYQLRATAAGNMTKHINAGVFLLNFNGHGGGNVWSDLSFFSYNDLPNLYNGKWGNGGKLPVVFSLTCLTGFFESVTYRSLGEEFVRNSESGAIAFYGASGYTSRRGNITLNRILLEYALEGQFTTLGELLQFAEIDLLARYGTRYTPLIRQYNLLGDPALPWQLTPDTMKLSLRLPTGQANDTVTVSGVCTPVATGQARLQVRAGDEIWDSRIAGVAQGSLSERFAIKPAARTAGGMVRVYAWNDSAEVKGWTPFSKDTLAIRGLRITPSFPAFGDSVMVSCELDLPDSQLNPAVYCRYAITSPQSTTPVYRGIEMFRDSTGRWTTREPLRVAYTDEAAAMLLVRFRITAGDFSKESGRFTFGIRGRPDLLFTGGDLTIGWSGDSLSADFEVLNKGNAPAPPFRVVLFRGDTPGPDTMAVKLCGDSLPPGGSHDFAIGIPDTQGTIVFVASIAPEASFDEISRDNNTRRGSATVWFRDMIDPADTLFSGGKGVSVSPSSRLAAPTRVFLFDRGRLTGPPLQSESRWLPSGGDSTIEATLGLRPPLAAGDSLDLTFYPSSTVVLPSGLGKSAQDSATGKIAIMTYDTLLARWRYFGGQWNAASGALMARANDQRHYSLAWLSDTRSPDIRMSIHGRELRFLDYAAKGKPFSIFLTDASGILPQSISVTLNGAPLPPESRSTVPQSGELRSVSLTAYPLAQRTVDSLAIAASDLAGNSITQTYAYMPGEELSIRFLSCHPNPFTARPASAGRTAQTTRFAFLLTDVADNVSLAIHTASGKKIKLWRFIDLIGYQEIEWDGRDRAGSRIANGTYYAKLVARNDRKKVTKTIRIAKLEGY